MNNSFEWNLDSDISITTAKALIKNQCFAVDSIEQLGIGFDNLAFLVNQDFVFRFPRHKTADEYQLKHEIPLLQQLAPLVSLKIPYPLYIGAPTQAYQYHFQGYKKIEGSAACDVTLTESEQKACLERLAHFLKQLHRINAPQAQAWGVEKNNYNQTNIEQMILTLEPRIKAIIKQNIYTIDLQFIAHEIEQARLAKIPTDKNCLVHADLHMKHIIINQKKLTGIIDWGDVTIGNPLIDFAIIHEFFPTSMHSIFFKIYGSIDTDHWQYARFLALKSIITTMLYAYDIKDESLLATSTKAYQQLYTTR